jgi:hypothetical protein
MVIYCTILDAENWYAGGIKAMRVLKPWLTNEPEIVGILVYIFYKLMGFGIQKLPHWLFYCNHLGSIQKLQPNTAPFR